MLPEIITVLVNALCYFHLPLLTPKMRETELIYQSEFQVEMTINHIKWYLRYPSCTRGRIHGKEQFPVVS